MQCMLPSELLDMILVMGGPMSLAQNREHVAACRMQRAWRSTADRIVRPPWAVGAIKFRWKRMFVPFDAVEPFASTEWRDGTIVPLSGRSPWGIRRTDGLIVHLPHEYLLLRWRLP